jgi:hypothetical protein
MAFLDGDSEERLSSFFIDICGVKRRLIKRNMHCTVYHARRPMNGITDIEEPISITVPGKELRMMAMAPGGENPRPDIDPTNCPIGIRIRRAAGASDTIEMLRNRFIALETPDVLGSRSRSNRFKNAFGARHFQPHITVLRTGAISNPDLSVVGSRLRDQIHEIFFDRLVVKYRRSW